MKILFPTRLKIPKFKLLSASKTICTSVIAPYWFVVKVNTVGFVIVDASIETPKVPINVSAVKS